MTKKSALTTAGSRFAVLGIAMVLTIAGLLPTCAPAYVAPTTAMVATEQWQDGDRVYSPRWDCYGTVCAGGTEVRWDGTQHTTDDLEIARDYGHAVRVNYRYP